MAVDLSVRAILAAMLRGEGEAGRIGSSSEILGALPKEEVRCCD